jgi:hypothetical protein
LVIDGLVKCYLSMLEPFQAFPALDLYAIILMFFPFFVYSFLDALIRANNSISPLISLIAFIGGPICLILAVRFALILIDPFNNKEGNTQPLIDPQYYPCCAAVVPGGYHQSADNIGNVVHLRNEEDIHHQQQGEEGRCCWHPEVEDEHLEEDRCEGTRVSGVEEVPSVVVGYCEREEAGASPDDVVGIGELLDILNG